MNDDLPDGATPVDPEEECDLLPKHIRTRGELNLWEQQNILEAARWIRYARRPALSVEMLRKLHRRMFSETWTWAGRFRTSDKTIGIHWAQIPMAVTNLVEDGQLWVGDSVFSLDEAALRLHHRLVQIHPFPNGNGRHARLWSDLILRQHGRPPLNWGGSNLNRVGGVRSAYISALRAADDGDMEPLLAMFLSDRPFP